jgi:hypothetical protein
MRRYELIPVAFQRRLGNLKKAKSRIDGGIDQLRRAL